MFADDGALGTDLAVAVGAVELEGRASMLLASDFLGVSGEVTHHHQLLILRQLVESALLLPAHWAPNCVALVWKTADAVRAEGVVARQARGLSHDLIAYCAFKLLEQALVGQGRDGVVVAGGHKMLCMNSCRRFAFRCTRSCWRQARAGTKRFSCKRANAHRRTAMQHRIGVFDRTAASLTSRTSTGYATKYRVARPLVVTSAQSITARGGCD